MFVGIDALAKDVRVAVAESVSRAFERFQAVVVQILHQTTERRWQKFDAVEVSYTVYLKSDVFFGIVGNHRYLGILIVQMFNVGIVGAVVVKKNTARRNYLSIFEISIASYTPDRLRQCICPSRDNDV